MTLSILLIVIAGGSAASSMIAKDDTINGTRTGAGKLVVTSSDLYQALATADAVSSSTFLSDLQVEGAQESYEEAVRDASQALASAATQVANDSDAAIVAELNVALPTYTGLVETARTYDRMNLPVTSAHLRLASTMMSTQILPKAEELRDSAQRQLNADQSSATSIPWAAFAAAIVALAFLITASVWLSRLTNRTFNLGLMGATLAMAAMSGWLILSSLATTAHLDRAAGTGSEPFEDVSNAQIAAQQAAASESILFLARGEDATAKETFESNMEALIGEEAMLADIAAQYEGTELGDKLAAAEQAAVQWRERHGEVFALMGDGEYEKALELAMGSGEGTVVASFRAVDDALDEASETSRGRFERGLDDARRALSGTAIGLGALAALAVGSAAIGLQRRIREYQA
ncbi:hypothetical protein [Salininema proteolyticum]|uniref:Chemotaxis methyl-accepting receptor HlyB-like 4HB MCP domain-containing protein n=1 Tax=Salininema proteolyticum TaxID=1607685 RepID=A0ABV8U1D0_9ACTN